MTPRRYDLANIPGLKVLGRCPELTKSLTLFWTGSGLAVAVAATELWVELYADYERLEPWLDIIINGDLSQRLLLTRGQQRICVFRGQSPDIVKQVRLLRDTQAMSDDDRTLLQIRALETDGHFLSPPEPALKLEFIGDSITSGEGASGAVSETDWVPACFSAYYNYTYETAARLAADYHCLSQSGWGVYTGWDGNRRHALPLYYPQICGVLGGARNLRLGATAAWDFTAFKPDYIIINLGTNDAGALQASPAAEQAELSAQIEQAAVAFWQQLRQLNPASYLIWAYGMLGHPLLPQLTRALQTYQRLSSDDRAELLLLPSAEQTGYGSRQHPGKAAHRAAAAVLTRRVRQLEDQKSPPGGAAPAAVLPPEGKLAAPGSAAASQPDYLLLCRQLEGLQQTDTHALPLLANTTALLKAALPQVNWVGFYLLAGQQLVLGPFQGKVACIHITLNQGVCGRAASEARLLNIADVHAFPGYIACDPDSCSELVLPVFKQNRVVAVLDLDSPRPDRFTAADEAGLTALVRQLEQNLLI